MQVNNNTSYLDSTAQFTEASASTVHAKGSDAFCKGPEIRSKIQDGEWLLAFKQITALKTNYGGEARITSMGGGGEERSIQPSSWGQGMGRSPFQKTCKKNLEE